MGQETDLPFLLKNIPIFHRDSDPTPSILEHEREGGLAELGLLLMPWQLMRFCNN